VLDPRLRSQVRSILPQFLIRWLDPVEDLIDAEVRGLAGESSDQDLILDAGAGEARHRRFFGRGRYLALDTGQGDPSWDYSNLDIRGDLEQLPLRARSIDAILCLVVLEHARDPRRVLVEFARVLKPGGRLILVVPFLWEEHQIPHDYFRFTRYGVRLLFENLPFKLDLLQPIGGFFWVCARRCVNLLDFFQEGWRWFLFVLLAPLFGFLFPLVLFFLDGLDRSKNFSLGYRVRATKDSP